MELSGLNYTESDIIQAKIADSLAWLVWSKTKDAEHNQNKPERLVDMMIGKGKEKETAFEHDVFNSKEDFLKAREKALSRYK